MPCWLRPPRQVSSDTIWSVHLSSVRLLAASLSAGVVSEQLCDLSVALLLEVWLLSCCRCFPSRALWVKGRQMLSSWRHQLSVVEQWRRVVTALTSRWTHWLTNKPTQNQNNQQPIKQTNNPHLTNNKPTRLENNSTSTPTSHICPTYTPKFSPHRSCD